MEVSTVAVDFSRQKDIYTLIEKELMDKEVGILGVYKINLWHWRIDSSGIQTVIKVPKISHTKIFRVKLNPLHIPPQERISCREFSKLLKRKRQKFDPNFYPRIPFRYQPFHRLHEGFSCAKHSKLLTWFLIHPLISFAYWILGISVREIVFSLWNQYRTQKSIFL